MITYKEIICPISNTVRNVQRSTDNAIIPFDEHNSDYQQYLVWLSEGNTPLPPDEQP
jgi:hypothetical protein